MCLEFDNTQVKLVEMKKRCRYHKNINQKYDLRNIAPCGLCLEAFHSAYPFSLALLYDSEFCKDNAIISCPSGKVVINVQRIQTLPKIIKKAKTLAEKLSENLLDFPISRIDYKIRLKLISVKNCPLKHKVGEIFWFNIKDKCELCPASFNSLLPFILSRNYPTLINCPDHKGMIYEVKE